MPNNKKSVKVKKDKKDPIEFDVPSNMKKSEWVRFLEDQGYKVVG